MLKTMQKVGDNISLSRKDGVTIIFIRNNLSYQTADELRAGYEKIKDNKILVDLGGVTITTSRGMATLIAIILDAEERNQKVCLCNVSRVCMNIIDAMDIRSHVTELKIFDTLDEGLEYLHSF
jgi:anti-anti-sigma regulatory factor